jgi:hypothetical protein
MPICKSHIFFVVLGGKERSDHYRLPIREDCYTLVLFRLRYRNSALDVGHNVCKPIRLTLVKPYLAEAVKSSDETYFQMSLCGSISSKAMEEKLHHR